MALRLWRKKGWMWDVRSSRACSPRWDGPHLDNAGGKDLIPQRRLAGAAQRRQRASALRRRQVVRLRRARHRPAVTPLPLPPEGPSARIAS